MYTTVIDHDGAWFMRTEDIENYKRTFGQCFQEYNTSKKTVFVDPIVSNARTILSTNSNLQQVRSPDKADLIVIPSTIPTSNRSTWGRRWEKHCEDGTIVGFKYYENSPSGFIAYDNYYCKLTSITKDAYDFIFNRLPNYEESKLISIHRLVNLNEHSSDDLSTVEAYLNSDDPSTVFLGTTMLLQMRFNNLFPIITLFSKCGKHVKKVLGEKQTQYAKLLEAVFPEYSSTNAYCHYAHLSTYSPEEVNLASKQITDLLKHDLYRLIQVNNLEIEQILRGNNFSIDVKLNFIGNYLQQFTITPKDLGGYCELAPILSNVVNSHQYTQSVYVLGLLYSKLSSDMQEHARYSIRSFIINKLKMCVRDDVLKNIDLTIVDNNVQKTD